MRPAWLRAVRPRLPVALLPLLLATVTPLLLVAGQVGPAAAASPGARFVKNGNTRVWPAPPESPDGAPKLGLNVPFAEEYLESLRSQHRGGEPAVVDRLLKQQQLWRRSTGVLGPEGQSRYSLIDCTPMYIHERSWLDVLRRVKMRLYTCHSICLDYPACTTTTPLAYVEPAPAGILAPGVGSGRRLAALTQCGMRVLRGDNGEGVLDGQILDLTAGSAGPVCTNTPPRARNPTDGDAMQYFIEGTNSDESLNISIWAQPGTQLQDGLILNVNDLWSDLQVQPLRLLNAVPGTDMWTRVLVPTRGALDLRVSVAQVARALANAVPTPADLKALWVVSPEPGSSSLTAQFMHTMDDTCPRWITFPFAGIPNPSGSILSGYSNSSGPCSGVINSMEKVGAYLAGIPVSTRRGGSCEVPNNPEYNTSTAAQCAAADRLGTGTSEPLALQAPLHSVAEKAVVRGCSLLPLFMLDTFPGFSQVKCGPAYAMPALEVVINTGAFRETFQDAGVLSDALRDVGSQADLSARFPSAAKWLDLRVQANASHFEELIAENYRRSMRELDNLKLGPQAKRDRTAILTALGLLLVATFQLPLAYDRNVRRTMASIANRISCGPYRSVRAWFVFFGALVTLAAPIGAAMMSLVLATKASEDEVLLAGYPELLHISAPLGTKEGAVLAGERLGLDVITAITVTQRPFWFGITGICAGCFVATIVGASFSAYQQWKEDAPLDGEDVEKQFTRSDAPPRPPPSIRTTPPPSTRGTPPPSVRGTPPRTPPTVQLLSRAITQ